MASIDDLDVRNCAWHAMRVGELLESIGFWKRETGQNPQMADFDELAGHFMSMESRCLLVFDPNILEEIKGAVLVNEGWESAAKLAKIAIYDEIAPYSRKTTHFSDFRTRYEREEKLRPGEARVKKGN